MDKEFEIAYDINGKEIKEGDKVIWTDPEFGYKAEYEVWGTPNEEMVKLWSPDGACEALPEECEVISE